MKDGSVRDVAAEGTLWLPQALGKLDRCAQAVRGWDSYDGLPLIPSVYKEAERLLRLIENEPLPPPNVVLGSGGTVQFEWCRDERQLEVEVLADGTLGYLKVFPDQEMTEGSVDEEIDRHWHDLVHWLLNG